MHDHGRRGGLNARVDPECVRIRRVAVEVPINAGPLVPLALVLAAPNLQALADPGEWHRTRRVDRRSELPLLAGHIHLATSDIAARDFQVIRTTILQPGKFESSVLIDPRQFVVRDNKVARRVASFPDVTHRPHKDVTASPVKFAAAAICDGRWGLSSATGGAAGGAVPGTAQPLALRVLGPSLRRLAGAMPREHGHAVLLTESFVDRAKFLDSCCRAANWRSLRLIGGYARQPQWRHHGQPKEVRVCELTHRTTDSSPRGRTRA